MQGIGHIVNVYAKFIPCMSPHRIPLSVHMCYLPCKVCWEPSSYVDLNQFLKLVGPDMWPSILCLGLQSHIGLLDVCLLTH